MPLIKKAGSVVAIVEPPKMEIIEKPSAEKEHKKQTLSKDEYWIRREERDVATQHRISRAGIYQAVLASVGVLQYSTGTTLEAYLELVEKVADAGLKYITREQK